MEKKLLVGIAIVALLLLVGVTSRDGKELTPQTEAPGELIRLGRFVLESDGTPLLEESFTLFFHPVDGYMLISQGTLSVGGEMISLAQQSQYDKDFLPLFYHLAAETPSGTQIISAQLGIAGLTMEVRVGLGRQSSVVADTSNIALLDNNLIGQYAVLLRAIRAETIDRNFTAAVPQLLTSLPARISGPNVVSFRSGEDVYEGKGFELQLADTAILLIEHEGVLVGLVNRTRGTVAYDVDRFPQGIDVEAEARHEPAAEGLVEHEIAFASGNLALAGTLTTPEGGMAPFTAAVFVHGSGPVDRDGNAVGLTMDAYRQLAHALARAGVASLRFDKRGVGASDGVFNSASRSDLLDDLHAAVEALRSQPNVNPDRIILIGHSEGAYLSLLLAAEDPSISGIILLAGAARPLDEITRWQVESLLKSQGATQAQIAAALLQQDQYIAFVESSEGEWGDYSVASLQEALPWLVETSAEQLLATPLALSWLREHYLDEPADSFRAVGVPVLSINGEKDSQVPASEAGLIRQLLEEAGNEDVTALVLADLNHLLRHHPEEPNLVYRHLDEPVDPRVIEAVTEWVIERFAR